jgi:hypothetical protein
LTDNNKQLLSKINKLITKNLHDEGELGDIYELISRYYGVTNKAEQTASVRLNNPAIKEDNNRKLIAIDFDGVIHSWIDGSYKGDATVFDNPPVPGAIKWLTVMVNDNRFFITIYSSRSKILGFEQALYEWLYKNGMKKEDINKLSVSVTKPIAFLFIDDRSWKFNGKFPNPSDLLTFKAWYEKVN